MPLIGVVLNPGATGTKVSELHNQLSEFGAVIDPSEQAAKKFGDSTAAAVRGFREQHGLPPGETVDLSTGRLMYAASAFAGVGGRAALRAVVREVAPAADISQPQELYWLARYATLAGDYETAHTIAKLIPDHQDINDVIDPILKPPDRQPQPPELPYPENFYTYRHDLYPLDVLRDVQREVLAVGEPPRHASQASRFSGQVDEAGGRKLIQIAATWLEAIKQWQIGNREMNHRRYEAAQAAYDACQSAACDYFNKFHSIDVGSGTVTDRLTKLIKDLWKNREQKSFLWSHLIWRRGLLSLQELHTWDFPEPGDLSGLLRPRAQDPSTNIGHVPDGPDYGLGFIQFYFHRLVRAEYETLLEAPLVTIAFVLAPLARAEANRARRQYDAAIRDMKWVLDSVVVQQLPPAPFQQVRARLACEFIELPFARLLLAETMLDKADAEFKARIPAEPSPAPDVNNFQALKAAQTYLAIRDVFKNEGAYVSYVETSVTRLAESIQERLAANDTSSQEFQILGKRILVPTLASSSDALPGLDRQMKAHEPLLTFVPPEGQEVMRETNPRVYAALLTATAHLEQLKAGFNYLGYLDTYVPPWRFQFLLERARYFAEHAKNAQREYLNFLSNAEREEFQELSASQNVEMEKSNVRIETARVDQVLLEVQAARESADLARLHAQNAKASFEEYERFDEAMDQLFDTTGLAVITASLNQVSSIPGLGTALDFGVDFFSGGAASKAKERQQAAAQRELEKHNLERAAKEASRAAQVAKTQLAAAQVGLVVTGLQRQAALLRHEFALQNLQFLRNRTLNTEQWYRLVATIRSVSETYLRYAVELAFLAEQAYEFEADKRINVIRFDYDLSEVGDFLAADFLMRDLDTLEKDLIITQRQRHQHIRYVLSMAREFPEALQELRGSGKVMLSLRLEQLEKRFPGLYNMRIGTVDVLPIALMDSTRFSLELTHLGTSQVRLKVQPDTPPEIPSSSTLNTNDLPVSEGGWLAELQETWPIKLRVTGPETAVFSGLTRQEANMVFAFATTGQRQAFESLGAAAAWQVDFTARENQVVPGTLADLLITFTLSGYHDPELRSAIDLAPRTTTAVTQWLSGRTTFPDALYEFNRSGRMTWKVTRDLLTLTDSLGAVRNAAVLLLPESGQSNYFGRITSRCEVQISITSAGDLKVLNKIPQMTFSPTDAANPLRIGTQVTLSPGEDASWDFGDGSVQQSGANQQHVYAKPGRYIVILRIVNDGHLSEFRADVVVSRLHSPHLRSPVTAIPTLQVITGADPGFTRIEGKVNTSATDPVIAGWRVAKLPSQKGNQVTFDLKEGDYTLSFTAVRPLKGCVYSRQRFFPNAGFEFNGLSLSSNRRFDLDGNESTGTGTNPPANAFTTHLFDNAALSPIDEWTVEIPFSGNDFLRSVSATDVEQYDLSEIADVVLALEYETTLGGF
jgi:hypothetical protein